MEPDVDKVEVNNVKDGNDEEALKLEADKGEMLNCIVYKILLTTKFKEDNQCNMIFKTCCTINDNVYNVIIDSGSSENIIL